MKKINVYKSQVLKATTWLMMIGSFLIVVGIIMISSEILKFQKEIGNPGFIVGVLLLVVGTLGIYLIFAYTLVKNSDWCNYAGPVVICTNCFNIMIGTSLVIVAYILPLSVMFAFLAHTRMKLIDGTTKYSTNNQTVWQDPLLVDLERSIRMRVTLFGNILLGIGLIGFIASSTILCRFYTKKQKEKKKEAERRKESSGGLGNNDSLKALHFSKRGSVYDYAGWESRSKDLYSEKLKPLQETETLVSGGKHFNEDSLTQHKLSGDFVFNSPFESASKGSRKFSLSPSPGIELNRQQLKLPS